MAQKLKFYGGVFDGNNEAIVAAPNQKEAARLLGCSLYHFRQYGHQLGSESRLAVAMRAPGRVFKRKYVVTRGWEDTSGWEMQPEQVYASRQSKTRVRTTVASSPPVPVVDHPILDVIAIALTTDEAWSSWPVSRESECLEFDDDGQRYEIVVRPIDDGKDCRPKEGKYQTERENRLLAENDAAWDAVEAMGDYLTPDQIKAELKRKGIDVSDPRLKPWAC